MTNMGKVDSLQLVANFKTRLKVAFKHLKRLYIFIRLCLETNDLNLHKCHFMMNLKDNLHEKDEKLLLFYYLFTAMLVNHALWINT